MSSPSTPRDEPPGARRSTDGRLAHLFQPLRVGRVTLRNRIVSSAHTTFFAREVGVPNEQHVAYHEARARGGVGLIVTEGTRVLENSIPSRHSLAAFDDRCIAGFTAIADAVHRHGVPVFGQLSHMGRHMTSAESRTALWAPSAVPGPLDGEVPHAMDEDEIQQLIQAFAAAGGRLQRARYDGCEIHASHGYLLQQFLSPYVNRRTDRYGGSLENRMRLLLEVIAAVRRAVGPDFVVGLRISIEEWIDDGLRAEDMEQVALAAAETGHLDYISATQSNDHPYSFPTMIPDESYARGAFTHLAGRIRAALRSRGVTGLSGEPLPVFTVGRIKDADHADRLVAEGLADAVIMTRALIADPELPAKAREGRLDLIRPCISCNQGCIGLVETGRPLSCLQNPVVGEEARVLPVLTQRAARPRRVLVIGGGPAGLEAAVVAAQRGHRVTLWERAETLGGQIRQVTRLPKRSDFIDIVTYRQRMLSHLDVTVKLGVAADAGSVQAAVSERGFDVVVVATGSVEPPPSIEQDGSLPILGPGKALAVDPSWERVLVWDGDGHYAAAALADLYLDRGLRVTLASRYPDIAPRVPTISRLPLKRRLHNQGVDFLPERLVSVHDGTVAARHAWSGAVSVLGAFDAVIVVEPRRADDALYHELKIGLAGAVAVRAVGDCYAPRLALDAIRDGQRCVLAI